MLLSYINIIKILPVIRLDDDTVSLSVLVKTTLINYVLTMLKYHHKYQFKVITCISGMDCPRNFHRFQIIYELLSVNYNARVRVKLHADELVSLDSMEHIFSGASWWEREIWDMFGVWTFHCSKLPRLLTDYGFQGYPLRKDFPLTGFLESRYNTTKKRVGYEDMDLAQEYRTFNYFSPWEFLNLNK